MAKKKNTGSIIRNAAVRTRKKPGGLKRGERANIVRSLGQETNPTDLWNRSNAMQKRRWQRVAKKRGVTVQGLLSGGPRALQERSPSGMRRQARKDVSLAYKAAEGELNDRELKARNLNAKQMADAERFDIWMAGEQAKLEASAKAADEALRSRYDAISAAQNAGFTGAGVGASAATEGYGQERLDLARTAAAGATGAAAREAERAIAGAATRRSAYGQSTLTAATNRRYELDSAFREELSAIGKERKTLGQSKTADVAKEIARLRDQSVEVSQANRESRMLGRELGLKEFEARSDAANDRAQNRLNWKKFKADLTDDQLRRALDRVKVQIAAGELSRKERADAERARHNLQTELNARRRLKGGGGGPPGGGGGPPGGGEWSEGAKNRWGQVINLSSYDKKPKDTPRLLWEAARALKQGGLHWDLYQRLVNANVAVPNNLRPRPNRGMGPR